MTDTIAHPPLPEPAAQSAPFYTAQQMREHCEAVALPLLKACRQALYALKGREHDGFLRDAIEQATGEKKL